MSMLTHEIAEEFILRLPNARLEYPFGEDVAVYKVEDKMFALIAEDKQPVRLSLKCDPGLSKVLRGKYTEVQEGYRLDKKHWNTIVLSGQLSWEEVQGLIRHSYDLVLGKGE